MASPETKAEYEQFIETFTFREPDGIKIPKNVRKLAYSMAIDLIIVSSARVPFYDYNCTPPKSFYGKATLVKENFLDEPIDVTMPRQRLYYGRVDEAFRHWQSLVDFDYHRYYYDLLPRFFIGLLEGLKGVELLSAFIPVFDLVLSILEIECLSLPDMPWLELPLREVYFNPLPTTQYEIEVSYYSPIPITDGCGNERTGESFQTDGEKDDGLPDDGVMPDIPVDPDNPFTGLPPVSSEDEQGEFANNKTNSLGDINPDNMAEDLLYWLEFRTQYVDKFNGVTCSTKYSKVIKQVANLDTVFISWVKNVNTQCNTEGGTYSYNYPSQPLVPLFGFADPFGSVLTYNSGLVLPVSIIESNSPIP